MLAIILCLCALVTAVVVAQTGILGWREPIGVGFVPALPAEPTCLPSTDILDWSGELPAVKAPNPIAAKLGVRPLADLPRPTQWRAGPCAPYPALLILAGYRAVTIGADIPGYPATMADRVTLWFPAVNPFRAN